MRRSLERAFLAFVSFVAKIEGKKWAIALFLIPLWPLFLLSYCFGRLASWRLALYAKGIFRVKRLDCFVISIGNLTSGGSGKTPLVEHLSNILAPLSPAILSRGYGSRFFRSSTLINDEMGPLYPPQLCGDEPYLLALCANAPIVIDKDRVLGGEFICANTRARALLLDDGFQHRRLFRDCDILLIEASHIIREPLCLPAGLQRNRLIDCSYADLVLITNAAGSEQWSKSAHRLGQLTKASIVGARFDLRELIPLKRWQAELAGWRRRSDHPLCLPKPHKIFVLCALANPHRFEQTLTRAGLAICGSLHLPDHALIDQMSVERACRRALMLSAEAIVCTEKDAVKWSAHLSDLPILVARSHWQIDQNRAGWDEFLSRLKSRIKEASPPCNR